MTYIDQNVTVGIEPFSTSPVYISFSHINLCMTTVDASWLAANIQRVIREIEEAERKKAIPLTVEQRRNLKVGDRILVREDAHKGSNEQIHEVRQEPWQLGHGTWVIGLKGISGGYALDRVVGILPKEVTGWPR